MLSIDLSTFAEEGLIAEATFFDKAEKFKWEAFRDKTVLIKSCNTTVVPSWAIMAVASRLAIVARTIRYGNEHSNIVVYRKGNH